MMLHFLMKHICVGLVVAATAVAKVGTARGKETDSNPQRDECPYILFLHFHMSTLPFDIVTNLKVEHIAVSVDAENLSRKTCP